MIEEHEIELFDVTDKLVLFISQDKENTLFINEDPNIHEAKYQIKEGCTYDFSFSNKAYSLRCPNHQSIVRPHKKQPHVGKLQPNIYVGTLDLEVFKTDDEESVFPFQLEVQSVKTNYRKDYRKMLKDIAEYSTDLILQANSPVNQSLEINPNLDNQTLYQRFSFIKSMIENEDFELAIHKIIYNPSTQWKHKHSYSDVRKVKKFTSRELNSLISSANKVRLPNTHPLRNKIDAVATKVRSVENFEDYDTNENRFIKYALETYLKFCEKIYDHKNAKTQLKKESSAIIELLENHLQHGFFKNLSRPQTLNLNSPLLQRKSGYREQLKLWLQFDLAAKLIWEGGNDVYNAGKKDIAVLYEYWLFFQLLGVMKKVFQVEPNDISKLINNNGEDLSLQLKQGNFTPVKGIYNKGNRPLNVTFCYNKSFKGNAVNLDEDNDRSASGSWTTTMRPDYTLSIWPRDLIRKDAEKQEQIVHVHFDAKYKIANLHQFLDSDLDAEKLENKLGIYKNADLLKMHAYKDAIKRTSGAYIIYPGTEDKIIKGFHEVLPGLGAFAISPTKEHNATDELEKFLQKVLNHFLNRASQRENIATKTYEITDGRKQNIVNDLLPEYLNGKKLIPDETYVLVGYCSNLKNIEWYKKEGKYNFRMNDDKGSLILENKVVDAKYLLLRKPNEDTACTIFKIISKGPKVVEGKRLKGYKSKNLKDYYLVIDIENNETVDLGNAKFKFKELKAYKEIQEKERNKRKAAGIPFSVSLTELMKVKVRD